MISSEIRSSELYEVLSWAGVLSTEDYRIKIVRENGPDLYQEVDISYDDINHIGYKYPHFILPKNIHNCCEFWINNHYLNPKLLTWDSSVVHDFGILDEEYDTTLSVRYFHNPNIIYRYSNIGDDNTKYEHVILINITEPPYIFISNIEQSIYYITNNTISIPIFEWIDDTTVKIRAPYTKDIDFFICSNLVSIAKVEAGLGCYIDSPHSQRCYHQILVDHDSRYPIDARFYPCITVDKDCIVRVFSNTYHTILHPESTRLILYPEYLTIDDPYNTDDPYLSSIQHVEELISSTDSYDEILRKFTNIAAYCYRIWEKYPINTSEESDLIICDNSKLSSQCFIKRVIHQSTEHKECIVSTVPFEDVRDILFYEGTIFHNYRIINLSETSDGYLIEDPNGISTYVIDISYNPNDFVLIKFNTDQDSTIMNIGEYIDTNAIAQLHYKLNRFYRNLLVIKMELLDSDDYVRVSTVQPTAKDQYLWFELLINANPEEFKTNPIDAINLYGLNPDNIPEDVKHGAYKLDLEDGGGPSSYTEMLMTYYKLNKNRENYLTMQYIDGGEPDPRIKEYDSITLGSLSNHENMNAVVIEDTIESTETTIEAGLSDNPGNDGKMPGDLYAQLNDIFKDMDFSNDSNDNIGKFALDTSTMYTLDQTESVTMEDVEKLNEQEKLSVIRKYTSFSDESNVAQKYLTNPELLNLSVYRILSAEHLNTQTTETSKFNLNNPEEIQTHDIRYILSMNEPDNVNVNDLWIKIPAATFDKVVKDLISHTMMEIGFKMPVGQYYDDGNEIRATMGFDYIAHDTGTVGLGEVFQEETDQSLHKIHYDTPDISELQVGDIWYETLGDTNARVVYSDYNSIIVDINERLYQLQFSQNNIEAYAFDDILINFRGELGVKYSSILADLVNSGVIEFTDLNIFYTRLITAKDDFDPKLMRLYTGTSHIVSMADIEPTDYFIHYSSNIARFQMNYADDSTTNREREAAYRMCIDYSAKDFAFLDKRMLLFVNGKFIPSTKYHENFAGKIQLLDFHEIISTVDILYSKKDQNLIDMKKISYQYWPIDDTSTSIQRPSNYDVMEPIQLHTYTKRGYYDILLREYILNGKLERILNYLEEHKEEADEFVTDMVRKFHDISDIDLCGKSEKESRIILSGMSNDDHKYQIGAV